jgi:hypothetical protein
MDDCRFPIDDWGGTNSALNRQSSIINRQSSIGSLGHHLSVIEFHHSPDHMKGG